MTGLDIDFFQKNKGKKKKRNVLAGWEPATLGTRSLSSHNLGHYQSFSYGSPAPLLTKSISGLGSPYHPALRTVQRSLSSGQEGGILGKLAQEYPLKAEDYELLQLCGQGATAKVFRARCKPLEEFVAVKQVDLELAGENLDTIIQEAQLMAQLRHDSIPTMLACFVEETFLYMVMPYIVGGSVESAMNYGYTKGLAQDVVAPIMLPVLHALAYLHSQDIIHRDVKASNILLSQDAVVLGDFGIATKIERCLEETPKPHVKGRLGFGNYLLRKSYVGTPVWMAPEVVAPEQSSDYCDGDCETEKETQAPGIWDAEFWVPWSVPSDHAIHAKQQEEKNYGHDMKADIYAFGITVYEMAMGKPPYAGMPYHGLCMSKLNHDPPELPRQHEGKHFSTDMQDVVRLCLQRDPAKRPSAATLLKHRFFKWSADHRIAATNLLDGVPGPVRRLDSLNRRMKENARLGFENLDFGFAGDEHVPLYNIKSKDAALATQNFGPKEASAVLHNMISSVGVHRLEVRSSGGSMDGSSPKSQSLTSSMNTPIGVSHSRRMSFTKQKSFAKGSLWPHLPPLALNHAKAVLFASGGRKGFGVTTSYGHGFLITNLGTMEAPCWTGPIYVYLTGTKSVGVGENSRESVVLFRDMRYNELITSGAKFKLGDAKLIDAVEESLRPEDIISFLKEDSSRYNGVAFRHYANSKTWKADASMVLVDHQANAKIYGKHVEPAQIMQGKVPPPVNFRSLIEVLISAQQGRYERRQKGDSESDHSLSARSSGIPSLSRNISAKSIAKTSTESISTPVDALMATDVLMAQSPLGPEKGLDFASPPIPRSSFSMDGSRDLEGSGSNEGSQHSQSTSSILSHLGHQAARPIVGISRVASDPLLPQLVEEAWEAEMGTPPPYGDVEQSYVTSFPPELSSSYASPWNENLLVPRNNLEVNTAQRLIPATRCISDVASPPGSAEEIEVANPFSSASLREPMEVVSPSGPSMSGSLMRGAGSGKPPKPGRPSLRAVSMRSSELAKSTGQTSGQS